MTTSNKAKASIGTLHLRVAPPIILCKPTNRSMCAHYGASVKIERIDK